MKSLKNKLEVQTELFEEAKLKVIALESKVNKANWSYLEGDWKSGVFEDRYLKNPNQITKTELLSRLKCLQPVGVSVLQKSLGKVGCKQLTIYDFNTNNWKAQYEQLFTRTVSPSLQWLTLDLDKAYLKPNLMEWFSMSPEMADGRTFSLNLYFSGEDGKTSSFSIPLEVFTMSDRDFAKYVRAVQSAHYEFTDSILGYLSKDICNHLTSQLDYLNAVDRRKERGV